MSDRESVAERLRVAEQTRVPCAPPSSDFELDAVDAYAIQRANIDLRLRDGARAIGWKVGLTSEAIQKWLNVSEPDFGALLDDMRVDDGATVETRRLLQPRAEAEIAFVLGEDLGSTATTTDVIRATRFLLPAIEIIDSRVADWNIKWADTVADNASSGMFVTGSTPVPMTGIDLRLVGMKLFKNGLLVSTGAGAACLGHPLNAVAWLARTLGAHGEGLKAGDVVLSGALGPVTPVASGDWLHASISRIGDVRCRFR